MNTFVLGGDGFYRSSALQHFVWQRHGFGTRLGNPSADVTLRQIHSAVVWNAHALIDRDCEGDALITDDPGRSIGVRTADCVPILLLDEKRHAVGAVHAGWRGTIAEIAGQTIKKLGQDFGTLPADVYAALGPCIRECCYEVSEQVSNQLKPLFPEWCPGTGKRHVDLPEANRRILCAAGVSNARIFDSGLCTRCLSEQFFSFRREPGNPGRMLSSICRLG